MARHRQRVATGLQTRLMHAHVVYACPSAPSLTGAGGQSVGLYGGRCVGVFGLTGQLRSINRFAATHRPPPAHAVALLSTAKETDAMSEPDTFSSYAAVEPINDDTPLPDLSTFLGILKRMRGCEGADGLPWPENDVSPGRRVSLARTERALVGLLTVLEVLHSADRCRVGAEPERHLDEGVVDGLFLACRGLAEWACREVRPA